MKPKPTSSADKTPVRVLVLTMDTHLASTTAQVRENLRRELPGLTLQLHAASEWSASPETLAKVVDDIDKADIIYTTMLFLEDHYKPVLPALKAKRDKCDAMLCAMSAGEVTRMTRVGGFDMSAPQSGAMALLQKLRPKREEGDKNRRETSGAQQMRMLRRLPKMLRFIPGTAQDVRAYFLALQYWLGGSTDNMSNLVRFLVARYADGPRKGLRGKLSFEAPIEYPETGLYHPKLRQRVTESIAELPVQAQATRGTVGLLVLRSYVLAGNAAHYDGVIAALEQRGLRVIPAFASGLDAREAIDNYFMKDGHATIDALVSLTGFSLVGGPAYNDSRAAEDVLAKLNVPYVVAHPVEFQTLQEWQDSERGLMPVESTIMVAIPELDGGTGPMVFGGRSTGDGSERSRDMCSHAERASALAARTARLVDLRRSERAERKLAIVLFNFPPDAGNTGTAAYLSVFESLFRTLKGLAAGGYQVEVPESVDALRERIIHGNARLRGTHANVHTTISADSHVRRETWLREIESQWGPAPGKQLSNGSSIFVLGAQFGNVFVGVQPSVGYEGDPMRLLFEKGFAPTHAFSAFYRWIREDFKANAVLHFGTHGALEFMPGKQTGLSGDCWPDRMIGDLPNVYLYASNNPSEATIAKRRSAATIVSYLTPPVVQAGLYRGLADLKASIERWRAAQPDAQESAEDRLHLAQLIQTQAQAVDLEPAGAAWDIEQATPRIESLTARVLELEYTLIPHGLHVVGEPGTRSERMEMLAALANTSHGLQLQPASLEALVDLQPAEDVLRLSGIEADGPRVATINELSKTARLLAQDHELPALVAALDGDFIRPAPGGDLLHNPAILPTGRNIHGFDPFRIPSAFACQDGARQTQRLLDRHMLDTNSLPETVAIVLWGTDNLKSEGGPIAQALALMGARPRFDAYGRLAGAMLLPLEELGRPRIDVLITVSGIFRDLLPLQTKLLADAAYLAASAEESPEHNFVRKHALAYQQEHGCDLETASLRVFGNADGAYGSNVNHLIENGRWDQEDELAETYTRRKSFAFNRSGQVVQQSALLKSVLAGTQLAYQNLDSVDLGVTTVDHYFDTLGGISRAIRRANGGKAAPVYIGDQTQGAGTVRTLSEQVALETQTRMLNPKWYEGMLEHGYEGVRQIEVHITNTMGWSATTGEVAPWVYQKLTQTFVLDKQMRERLAQLNPTASAKVANRLIEAQQRKYWEPDEATLAELRRAGEELEDRVEGVLEGVAA
jgi:magnesium chelatase subunit H